jgi:(p)ppGpp synthase/HD superfamily hydrolase
MTQFEKYSIAVRYHLLGLSTLDKRFYKAIDAFELGLTHHTGQRNGGDPEFIHQLGIFLNLRTLHNHIQNPLNVYILAFLHDLVEDKMYALSDIENEFGNEIADKLDLLSKVVLGVKKENYSLIPVFNDVDCSIVKFADRVNNISTMVGVFKQVRLERYLLETSDVFLPAFKVSLRLFPEQECVYENLKLNMINQLVLIRHIIDGVEIEK